MSKKLETLIELFPMGRRIAKYQDLINTSFAQVLESGNLILGPQLKLFENIFAKFLGVNSCIGVANGTDAIELALRSLELPPKSLVATVANASNYASLSILECDLLPIFIDIEQSSQLTNLNYVKEGVAAGAKAVIVTHLYGTPVSDIREIALYCKENQVFLIEDCAQAHGAKEGVDFVGTFGDLSTFSFYPTKNLGGVGDAGLVATNNEFLEHSIRNLRNYGWENKYQISALGGRNSRMDELQACVLKNLLPYLEAENAIRLSLAKRIIDLVKNLHLQFVDISMGSVVHLFVVMTSHRAELQSHLINLGIQTGIHYPIIDSHQIGRESATKCNELSNSIQSATKILTIPLHPYLTETEVARIIHALTTFSPNMKD